MEDFDWKKATLLDLERENGAACRKLELLGFEAKPLQLKAPQAPTRLNANRVAIDAPEAEKVRALAGNNNMNLSTIIYTVGTQAVSGDVVMKAMQFQANQAERNKYKSEREALVAKKKVELAAKALLENGPSNARRGWLVKELRSLLKWNESRRISNTEGVQQ